MTQYEISAQAGLKVAQAMTNTLAPMIKGKLDEKQDIATMPTKVSDFANDSGFQNAQQVEDKIDAKVSSAYKAGGSATMATLPALTAAKLGVVVNMSEDFTTTADFLEGAGKTYPAGTNVVVAEASPNIYKYDVLAGFVDLSGYVQDTRKVGNVPLSADIPVSLTGDSVITVTNTGTASTIGYSVTHDDSGVTAGSKGDATNQTPGFGGTFKALSATVDAKGHVTALGDHTVKVPNATATTQADGLMSKTDKAKLDAIGVTASSPLEVTKTGETYNVTLKDSGVTAGSKGDATNQTPGFGGTFKALSATVDAKGRLTALGEHKVTIPSAAATASAAGLMSAADKAKLDKYASKGSATKGVYIDTNGAPQNMTYELNADVPANFAPASVAPLMDNSAAIGSSAKYAREDHRHPTDTSRASAADLTALVDYLKSMEVYRRASGNPATFDDGAAANLKNVSVTITPTQSGSGDPYPPGGGKNLLDASALQTVTSQGITFTVLKNAAGDVIEIDADGTSTNEKSQIFFSVPDGSIYSGMILSGCPGGSGSFFAIEQYASPYTRYVTDTGDGAIIPAIPEGERCSIIWRFPDAGTTANHAKCRPMIRRASDADPTFAPYSNIRPISGVSSATVTRTGKNLLEIAATSGTLGGVTFTVDKAAGTVTANGTATQLVSFNVGDFRFKAGTRYILSGCPAGGSSDSYYTYDGYLSHGFVDYGNGTVAFDGSAATGATRYYIRIASGITVNNLVFRPMIRFADTDAAFEPHTEQAVTVNLTDSNDNPLTVYGGTLDVTTGELVVTSRLFQPSASHTWSVATGPGGISRFSRGFNVAVKNAVACSHLPVARGWSDFSRLHAYAEGTTLVYFLPLEASQEAMQDFVAEQIAAGTPLQTLCELAAPVTYQLTPAQLATLAGYNAVSSDAGNVAVTYKADTAITFGGD